MADDVIYLACLILLGGGAFLKWYEAGEDGDFFAISNGGDKRKED